MATSHKNYLRANEVRRKKMAAYYAANMPVIERYLVKEATYREIAQWMNDDHVPTWKVGQKWSIQTVYRLLKRWRENRLFYLD